LTGAFVVVELQEKKEKKSCLELTLAKTISHLTTPCALPLLAWPLAELIGRLTFSLGPASFARDSWKKEKVFVSPASLDLSQGWHMVDMILRELVLPCSASVTRVEDAG